MIHETIRKVTHDIEHDFHFNTAISAVMELVNALHEFERASLDGMPREERSALLREAVEATVLLLGPVSPAHHRGDVGGPRPPGEPLQAALARAGPGRARPRRGGDRGAGGRPRAQPAHRRRRRPRRREIREQALADGKVRPWLDGRAQVAKVVVVPGRLVNIVTRG